MKIIDCLQYSPVWWAVRAGEGNKNGVAPPTASEFKRILTPGGKVSGSIPKYIAELIANSANPSAPFFTERNGHTAEMRNGTDCEPEARNWYAFDAGVDVKQVGFCLTDDERFGCSPDGLVYSQDGELEGVLELKCPREDTHVGYLLKGAVPTCYLAQCHGHLIVTGLRWVDFVSYCPAYRPAPAMCVRVTANDYTEALKAALESFWVKYQAALQKIGAF